MADIKTGIFAKNVQKRLNRAQEKVSRGRRAAGQVARGSAGSDGGAGLQQAARCRAAGPGAASCGARAWVGWRSPCLCARWLQLGSIHSDSVGMAGQWVRQRPADSRPPRQGVRQTTGARSGWPLSWARLRGLGVAGAAALWLHPERTASLGSSISPCPHAPPELRLSRTQFRRPWLQMREGDCRIPSSWVGVLWLFEWGRNERLKQRRYPDVHGPMGRIINNQHLRTVLNWSSRECTLSPMNPCPFWSQCPLEGQK